MEFDIEEMIEVFNNMNITSTLIDKQVSRKLGNIFNKYNKEDLFSAIFCLSSWRYNRPHVSSYLTMNDALINLKSFGTKRINNYSEFLEFVNSFLNVFDLSRDDEILCDFGEIRIVFGKKYYPVLLGTGHNFLLPFYESLDVLSKELDIQRDIQYVLEYCKNIIEEYGALEKYDSNRFSIDSISIPTETYFDLCRHKYTIYKLDNRMILRRLSNCYQKSAITTHFIKEPNGFYPLFNPSIVVDAFDYCFKNKNISSKLENKVMNIIVLNALQNNFDLSLESKNIGIEPAFLCEDQKGIINNKYLNYCIRYRDKVVLFVNDREFSNQEINDFILKINQLKSKKSLRMIIPDKYPSHRLYDVSEKNICFVSYGGGINVGKNTIKAKHNGYHSLYIYDLISMAYQAESLSNFINFFFLGPMVMQSSYNMYNGFSSLFDAWQAQNREFSQGAIHFTNIMTDVYAVEWYSFDKFNDYANWFPLDKYSYMFSNLFSWNVKNDLLDFKRIFSKSVSGFVGDIKKVKDSYLFVAFNLNFEKNIKSLNQRSEIINLIEEMNVRLLSQFEKTIYDKVLFAYKFLQITYLPTDYANDIDKNGRLNRGGKYVNSDMFINEDGLFIRYTINEKILINDLVKAQDKEVECVYLTELLSCMKNNPIIDFDYLHNEIMSHRNEKREIAVLSFEIKYLFSNNNFGLWPKDDLFVKVRKDIAIRCKKIGVNQGKYSLNEATSIIRKIQQDIIPAFENELSKYDKYDLHKKLLSINAFNYHKKRLDNERYGVLKDDTLTDFSKKNSEGVIIESREDTKHMIRTINYIIDTNLAISHSGNTICDDLEYIIAYGNWLVVLQDCADECHYNLFDASIEIDNDFRVNTIYSPKQTVIAENRNKRIYANEDYVPEVQNDEKYYEDSLESFKDDLGIDFKYMLQACYYLSREFSFTFKESIIPDVYEVKYEDLIKDYKSAIDVKLLDDFDEMEKAFKFLIIDEKKIKFLQGKIEQFVPIWDRENRDNRIDVKPLVLCDNKIIFSPVVMYELFMVWTFSSHHFYPPFEYGLKKYCKKLDDWKNKCEKQMESDIESFFKEKELVTKRSIELHKIDKGYGHPLELGDYDVISIDTKEKTIWNIESKFLGMVGSMKEYYNHQDSFFNRNKKDEKFSRRIEYLETHKNRILELFGIQDSDNYEVKNYMVTNKVFESDLKKIDFDIITFYELKQIVK